MEIELRPLSTGEVLDRTFRLYRAHFGVFVGIAGVAALLETAGNALQIFLFRSELIHGTEPFAADIAAFLGTIVQLLLVLVAASIVFGAITREVMALHHGRTLGIAGAYRAVIGRWFRYVRLAVMWWLASAWPFFLTILLVIVPLVAIPGIAGRTKSILLIRVMAGLCALLMFLIVPLCIWLFCRYALCMPASTVENLGVLKALKRSTVLSKGLRLRIFLLLLVVYVLQMILMVGLMIPMIGFIVNLAHTHGVLPIGAVIYQISIGLVMISLITPIYVVGLALIYIDARIRKEGYDIELMMQRSGGAAGEPAAGAQPGDAAPLAME